MDYSTKTLAKGCFGKIYKQKYKDTWAAIKKVPIAYITKEQLNRECRVYYKVHHNNVVKLLGDPWLENGMWHIPLEFIFGEDLETTIFNTQKSKIQLTTSVKATIITGMCEGLFHLHSKDIVHQDLKPDNIMVEHQTHRAVIIDMGLAKFIVNGLSSAQNLGNEAYSAPEILHWHCIRDKRSDVWAFGKIIAELCAGIRLPTDFLSSLTIRDTLKDNPYCSVVSKMVAENAAERPTMIAVIGEIRRAGAVFGADAGTRAGAGMGITNTRFEVHGSGRGKVVNDLGVKQIWHPPGPFPGEMRVHQSPAVDNHRGPSPQPHRRGVVPQNPQMCIPCPLPLDGRVIQHCYDEDTGQMVYKEIVTRHGRVVKYEDLVKMTKP
ncbi:hypothetical protein P4O66_004924 [Electrophorus voltai]|uniref:non-specific serine/threonine protein kinase n=1 Tax=Electrophorus voltai TaxID=2609070 RepID=A0AAD9A033_9TELE|nr:hypothetical protein P4O66_004924 [Electrophorus voltai]